MPLYWIVIYENTCTLSFRVWTKLSTKWRRKFNTGTKDNRSLILEKKLHVTRIIQTMFRYRSITLTCGLASGTGRPNWPVPVQVDQTDLWVGFRFRSAKLTCSGTGRSHWPVDWLQEQVDQTDLFRYTSITLTVGWLQVQVDQTDLFRYRSITLACGLASGTCRLNWPVQVQVDQTDLWVGFRYMSTKLTCWFASGSDRPNWPCRLALGASRQTCLSVGFRYR